MCRCRKFGSRLIIIMLTQVDKSVSMLIGGDKMLTRKELSIILSVSERTVDRYVKMGMPCIKVSKAVRFELNEVMKWLKGE